MERLSSAPHLTLFEPAADGFVVLDSGRVARGAVAFLELAQDGGIAEFSHIVFLSFVLGIGLIES